MEDGEAMELVQRAARRNRDQHELVELGGLGPIEDSDYLITEVSIRGLWKHYCHLMGYEVGGPEMSTVAQLRKPDRQLISIHCAR